MHIHTGDFNLPTLHLHVYSLPRMEKRIAFFLIHTKQRVFPPLPFPISFLGRGSEKVKREIMKFIPSSLKEPAPVIKTIRE